MLNDWDLVARKADVRRERVQEPCSGFQSDASERRYLLQCTSE